MSETKQVQEKYVPWGEGAKILGLKRSAFFYYVNSGAIKSEPGRGPREGRYRLQDILDIKNRRDSNKPRKTYKKRLREVELDWLTPDDVMAGLALDRILYDDEFLADADVYQSWRKKNPYISMAAYDKKDRRICLGYIGLIPLPEEIILSILKGEREETSITADEILTYDEPGGYTLLANSAAIHPERPDLLNRILRRITEEWIARYPEKYIRKIYAQSVSAKGDMFVQHFFMAPRYDLALNAFELDLARPAASKIIRRFKAALEEKAPLPPELQTPLV